MTKDEVVQKLTRQALISTAHAEDLKECDKEFLFADSGESEDYQMHVKTPFMLIADAMLEKK